MPALAESLPTESTLRVGIQLSAKVMASPSGLEADSHEEAAAKPGSAGARRKVLDLATFLAERVEQWGAAVHPSSGSAIETGAQGVGHFGFDATGNTTANNVRIVLTLRQDGQVCQLQLWFGQSLQAERQLSLADEVQAKIAAWLLVKSSLERLQITLAHRLERGSKGEPQPTRPQDRMHSTPTTHEEPTAKPTALALLAALQAVNETASGWSFGPMLGLVYLLDGTEAYGASLEASVGYRYGQLEHGVRLQQVPLRLAGTVLFGALRAAALGFSVQGAGKWAKAPAEDQTDRASGLLVGLDIGPFAQLAVPFGSSALLVRLGFERRLRPFSYVADQGEVRENPWALNVCLGWQMGAVH